LANLPAGIILHGRWWSCKQAILFRAFAIPQPGPCLAQDPVPCQDSSATYTVFDLLYDRFESLQTLPLRARRHRLKTVVRASANSRLVFSEGIVGPGQAFSKQSAGKGWRTPWPSDWAAVIRRDGARGSRSNPGEAWSVGRGVLTGFSSSSLY